MNNKLPIVSKKETQTYQIFFAVTMVFFILCTIATEFDPLELFRKSDNFVAFVRDDFFPPQLPPDDAIKNVFMGVVTTVAMAISSTTAGAILAFFVALFASEAVSPIPKFAKIVRGFATFLRNIPVLVWAFILFSSLGIGTGVGFVALLITSFAFMVRAFAETMDDISGDCVECLRATGATFPQQVANGILPSCLHGFFTWFLYCLEVNIRASTVVGMVGGGGIGLVLFAYLKSFKYHVACAVILLIVVMVILVDTATTFLRDEMNHGRSKKTPLMKDGRFVTAKGQLRIDCKDASNVVNQFVLSTFAISILSLLMLDIDWMKQLVRAPKIGTIFGRLAMLDFTMMDVIGAAMLESISVAVLSTIYGSILGLFLAMFAARNVFRMPKLSWCFQALATFCRAVPTPVWVLLVMVCIGMGPAAGIAGLCVHSTAFFVKSFTQSFESIPTETLEALEATGVNRFGVFMNAVLPSSLSQIVAWIGMRFEINFAECAVLGMVGAGGIGYVISMNIQSYQYGTAGVAILLVFLFAYGIECLFIQIKKMIR